MAIDKTIDEVIEEIRKGEYIYSTKDGVIICVPPFKLKLK